MAIININNLNSIGSDLFSDSESYLQDLAESNLGIHGGIQSSCVPDTKYPTMPYPTPPIPYPEF